MITETEYNNLKVGDILITSNEVFMVRMLVTDYIEEYDNNGIIKFIPYLKYVKLKVKIKHKESWLDLNSRYNYYHLKDLFSLVKRRKKKIG